MKTATLKQEKNAIVCAKNGYSICVENTGKDRIETRFELPEFIEAPAKRGQSAGKMIVLLNGEEVGQVELVLTKDYEKANFFDRIKTIISFWK